MAEKTSNEEKLDSAIHLFMKTLRLHRCVFAKTVSEMGMPHAQHRMLMYLAREQGSPSQKQIADNFEISPAAVAVSLKKLEGNGYIKRSSSPGDNRINNIVLTEKGRLTVNHTESSFRENDVSMFDGFSDSELDCYISLLEKIESNLHTSYEKTGRITNEKMV